MSYDSHARRLSLTPERGKYQSMFGRHTSAAPVWRAEFRAMSAARRLA